MEACIANLVEPGDTVVVGNNGIWGARVVDMAGRFGGKLAPAGVYKGCCLTYTLPDVLYSSLTTKHLGQHVSPYVTLSHASRQFAHDAARGRVSVHPCASPRGI